MNFGTATNQTPSIPYSIVPTRPSMRPQRILGSERVGCRIRRKLSLSKNTNEAASMNMSSVMLQQQLEVRDMGCPLRLSTLAPLVNQCGTMSKFPRLRITESGSDCSDGGSSSDSDSSESFSPVCFHKRQRASLCTLGAGATLHSIGTSNQLRGHLN